MTAVNDQEFDALVDKVREEDEPMLRFFGFEHLPPHLKVVSCKFYELACDIVALVPRNAERTIALRKLLESKDCAVRATLPPGE